MTRTQTTAIAAIFLALAVGACALETDDLIHAHDAVEIVDPLLGPVTVISGLGGGDDTVDLPGSMCDCTTHECAQQWIAENVGCGLCLHVICGDERVGACVHCDESEDLAAPAPNRACLTCDHPEDLAPADPNRVL